MRIAKRKLEESKPFIDSIIQEEYKIIKKLHKENTIKLLDIELMHEEKVKQIDRSMTLFDNIILNNTYHFYYIRLIIDQKRISKNIKKV